MPVLEFPSGGITRPKYDRVIANSLEELLAFTPEVPHVWGLVRGAFTRRYWDGVEWKVAGVIGSGPLASAPVASAANKDMWYNSTDFGLCKYVSVFNNAGSDWIDCGRPAWLNQLRPSVDAFTVRATCKINTASQTASILSLAKNGSSELQFLLVTFSGNILASAGQTATASTVSEAQALVGYSDIRLASTVAYTKCVVNSTVGAQSANGSLLYTGNLFIGRCGDGSLNMEGQIAKICVYSGANADGSLTGLTPIDCYDFNKWNGSGSGFSDAGYAYTVTKASPLTEYSFACIPVSRL